MWHQGSQGRGCEGRKEVAVSNAGERFQRWQRSGMESSSLQFNAGSKTRSTAMRKITASVVTDSSKGHLLMGERV